MITIKEYELALPAMDAKVAYTEIELPLYYMVAKFMLVRGRLVLFALVNDEGRPFLEKFAVTTGDANLTDIFGITALWRHTETVLYDGGVNFTNGEKGFAAIPFHIFTSPSMSEKVQAQQQQMQMQLQAQQQAQQEQGRPGLILPFNK